MPSHYSIYTNVNRNKMLKIANMKIALDCRILHLISAMRPRRYDLVVVYNLLQYCYSILVYAHTDCCRLHRAAHRLFLRVGSPVAFLVREIFYHRHKMRLDFSVFTAIPSSFSLHYLRIVVSGF